MKTITPNKLFRKKNPAVAILFIFAVITTLFLIPSCTTINPGEIGLKVVRGKLQADNYTEGRHHSGFGVHYVKFSTRIKEVSLKITLPTKEGIEAKADLTLLYHIKPEAIHSIYLTIGMRYENEIILNNFAATARETCLNYRAMDLMVQRFVIDQVLVRDIDVPEEIDKAIEKKVLSEQQVKQQEVDILTQKRATEADIEKQRKEMEFAFEKKKKEKESQIALERLQDEYAVEKQKKEAERSLVEAQSTKKNQDLINSSITPLFIQFKNIEVMKALADSQNSKLIITDGKTPWTVRAEPK